MLIDVDAIKKADACLKPGGADYDEDAIKLSQIYEDRSRELTTEYLRARGLGRRKETIPIEVAILRRIVESLAVTYRTPPVRRLVSKGKELADSNEAAVALAEVYGRMQVDLHWQSIDVMRTLYRQVVAVYQESNAHGCVQLRIFEPFNVSRKASVLAADILDEDEAILLCLRESSTKRDALYQAWMHENDGSWRCWLVDGHGDMPEGVTQPYGAEGKPPFDVLPAQLVYDEHPRGRAYLPIPQSRVSFALAINGAINDLNLLLQMEAHTRMHIATDDRGAVPTETGPDKAFLTPADASVQMLTTNPKIKESSDVIDLYLRLWLTGDTLPGDALEASPPQVTGAALKVRERDLNARRQRQVALAVEDERRAYQKIAAVHNVFAEGWGLPLLRTDAELRAALAQQYVPSDPKELQESMYNDISIGASSMIDYIMRRDGISRNQAIALYERVDEDLKLYPPKQNPTALLESTNAAGLDSKKTPGAFNPDRATATEGASVIDSVRKVAAA